MTETRNELAGSKSPFLEHGSHQPVHWLPWGEKAFDLARATDRPILLDIGAVWCHWCHVMDRESYASPQTASLINQLFIPVKVDRDESPDVDNRYQRAVQLLTGQGGWPLTAFLTPDGTVFYGGTYFPPVEGYGRPSFTRVLQEVHRVWTHERPRALEAASGIEERLAKYAKAEVDPGDIDPGLLEATAEELARTFDFRYGGFGAAPKFPHAGAVDLMLDHYLDEKVDWAQRVVVETLEAMGRGGICDQLGGGFHRYATDARWLIPHFEKMAYDNGVLLASYARAAVAFDNPFFRDIAQGILDHYVDVSPDLIEQGGFPGSQDADFSADDDGEYWTWTAKEITDALQDDVAANAVISLYGVDDRASAMHEDPARHVLFLARSRESVAREMGIERARLDAMITNARGIMKQVRDYRPRPYVDETLYSGWVSLVASGHLAAARWLGSTSAADRAIRALERMQREAFRKGLGLLHRFADDDSGVLLEDQAHAAVAFLDAYELTGNGVWLEHARDLFDIMDDRFRDDSGAFRDRAHDAGVIARPLAAAQLSITDSPTPSGNGSAALALLRYAALTDDDARRQRGLEVLRAFGKAAARLTSSAATYVKAAAWATRPVTRVVIVGDSRTGAGRDLHDVALKTAWPRLAVRWLDAAQVTTTALAPEIAAMLTGDAPRAYVCMGQTCSAPVSDPARLRWLITGVEK